MRGARLIGRGASNGRHEQAAYASLGHGIASNPGAARDARPMLPSAASRTRHAMQRVSIQDWVKQVPGLVVGQHSSLQERTGDGTPHAAVGVCMPGVRRRGQKPCAS